MPFQIVANSTKVLGVIDPLAHYRLGCLCPIGIGHRGRKVFRIDGEGYLTIPLETNDIQED
jgi:hypothetical protein